jgi:hypothetical protein
MSDVCRIPHYEFGYPSSLTRAKCREEAYSDRRKGIPNPNESVLRKEPQESHNSPDENTEYDKRSERCEESRKIADPYMMFPKGEYPSQWEYSVGYCNNERGLQPRSCSKRPRPRGGPRSRVQNLIFSAAIGAIRLAVSLSICARDLSFDIRSSTISSRTLSWISGSSEKSWQIPSM